MTKSKILLAVLVGFITLTTFTTTSAQRLPNKAGDCLFSGLNSFINQLAATVDTNGWITFKPRIPIQAGELFSSYKSVIGLSIDDELRLSKSNTDKNGNIHNRYDQYYKGIPVECGKILEHLSDCFLKSLNGKFLCDLNINVINNIAPSQAITIALNDVPSQNYMWQDTTYERELKEDTNDPNATYAPQPKLIIDCGGFLVYDLRVNTFDTTLQYRINAKTGLIISKVSPILRCGHIHATGEQCENQSGIPVDQSKENSNLLLNTILGHTLLSGIQPIDTKFSYGKHRLVGGDSATPIETRDNEGRDHKAWRRKVTQNSLPNNTWPISDRLHTQTHWAVGKAHDYFIDVHGQSVGAGNGTLKIKSNCGISFAGYLKDHRSLAFGFRNGLYLGVLDAAGHEFTHLMIHDIADLGSEKQDQEQDALNESFSDIFGTMVERQYRPSGWDWIFEDEAAPLRDVLNPSNSLLTGPQAVIYMGANWAPNGTAGSHHRNTGVQNRWFSLLSLGETHNGISVQGIGIENAASITHHNVLNYIEKSSQYIDSRNGAVNSARDLFGECSFEHVQTQLAWQACGRGIAQNCFTTSGSYQICSDKKNLPISQTVINSFGQNLTWAPVTINIFGQVKTTANWTYTVSGTNNSILTITNIPSNIQLGGFYYFRYTDQAGNSGFVGFVLVDCPGIGPNPPTNTDCASLSNYILGPRSKNNQESNENRELMVSPNPTNGKINIQSSIVKGNYRIIDLTGKILIDEIYSSQELDVSHLKSGTYIIEIFDINYRESGKFVKN